MTDLKEHTSIDIREIIKNIPHRYPFLLIDRVKNLVKNESATGVKNVSINESFFAGHFPINPVMPGVLIIESMAQTAGVLVCKSVIDNPEDKLVYFTSIEDVKFKQIVVPGDQLILDVKIERNKLDLWKFNGVATVDGNVVAKAKFAAKIIDKKDV